MRSSFSRPIIAKYIVRVGHEPPADPALTTKEDQDERARIEAAVVRFVMGIGRTRGMDSAPVLAARVAEHTLTPVDPSPLDP
jgi:hypothetical protein